MNTALPPSRSRLETQIDVGDGVRLWAWDTGGDGPAIVLLHASAGSGECWDRQWPVFAEAGYRVIGYSRRGHFGSDDGDVAATTTPASTDLLRLVDALGLERFHLIGTAAGGMVATDFAVSYPQRLLSFVISSSIVGLVDDDYQAMLQRLLPPEFERLPHDFRELGPSYRAQCPEGLIRWKAMLARSGVERVPLRFATYVRWPDLERFDFPVLVLTGDADLYAPPANARLIASRIPGARLTILPDSGHSPWWEVPELYNREILNFLGSLSR
ncbi:Pimeloyl-ACP methyl ester carboxylesterase [Bosea sp. CRIB-10]|uniref:alpha/beta fold hydrolase n=1 Tax=Bosea sp. CRIB-10 TaxID=378404 RepID=UPI0008E793F8|nr:alpha/beta hydrolase [Bosea sp. CRIB-10]SFB72959.1 Pimeloyl-ACP methyl ester carboxylesterase [Bosea sp. CRIB-10]